MMILLKNLILAIYSVMINDCTMEKELQEFIYFFTHNKSLTRTQQLKRDALLARDYVGLKYPNNGSHENKSNMSLLHTPQKVVAFLHQFTEKNTLALKYTSHYWDKNSDGNYPYASFKEFKEAYMAILNNKEGRPLSEIRPLCAHLWMIIKNFLVNDDGKYPWSEYKLKIGYNRYLGKWMDENPNIQPFSMPLSDLPEEFQPKELIRGKNLVYFNDVVDIFKHCIEFRDNDLYYDVLNIFKESPDHSVDKDLLNTLRGRAFYTDTELVKDAIRIIASNIFQRSEYPELKISCSLIGREKIELRILQVGSFSYKNVGDPKITANSNDGDMARIREKLRNLCDFSIESIFRVNEEPKNCRINYLTSKEGLQKVELISDKECLGFSYILTFYTYSNE